MPPPDPILLAPAETPADLDCVRELFTEYQHWLGIDLCFQGFEAELRALPGDYAPPGGCLLLARAGDEAVGVVGMRPLDGQACEMKRLWVRPPRRGRGLGRRLAEAVVEAGRRAGYAVMRLDTLARLEEGLALYESMGFVRIPAYRHNPCGDVLFLELDLGGGPRLLDHPTLGERLFFPLREAPPDPTLVDAGGTTLTCWSAAPHPDGPTLVHFHGNGEVVADYVPEWADAWHAAGFNVFLAEYRGYGGSGGAPALVAMLDDVDAVFRAAGVPAARMVVYGRSIGSIYALELAARHPGVAALVLESGIAAPLERVLVRVAPEELGGTLDDLRAEARRHLDHEAKLAALRCPVLVLHTRHDHLIALDHAERLARWSGGRLVVFETGDHNTILMLHGGEVVREVRGLWEGVAAELASRLGAYEARFGALDE